jgi:CHASE2 domain-containing sensor protein
MALIAQFVFNPSLLVVGGCFFGGNVIFLAWRASLVEKTNLTIVYAVIGLMVSSSGVIFSGRVPLPVLMAQSFPWLGVGLFLGILVARIRKQTT